MQAEEPLSAASVPPESRAFDVVLANILTGPLVDLAPRLAGYTKPGGALALSGVLAGDQARKQCSKPGSSFFPDNMLSDLAPRLAGNTKPGYALALFGDLASDQARFLGFSERVLCWLRLGYSC